MNGTVEALTPDWRGATLLTAVGSVLTVDDVADFDEEGGWLTIADAAPLEYVAVDEDADTVTLTGTAGTVEAGDPVVIWDPTVPPTGAKVVEYLASVMTDLGPVDAVIEHEKIPLAGVDTLVGASVSLTEDTYGTPYVDQVLGREPLQDLSYADASTLDVTTLPPVSDGNAPTAATTVTPIGGIGSMFYRWTEVDNADPVTYRLYVRAGASPAAPTLLATNLATDPSYELTESWAAVSGSTDPVRSTDRAWAGSYSVKFSRGAGTTLVLGRRSSFTSMLPSAGTYRVAVRMWVDPGITGNAGLRLSGTGVGATQSVYTAVRSGWDEVAITFTWDGVGTANFDVVDVSVTAGALIYVDGLILTAGSGVVAYFDGDTPDTATIVYAWTGTPNASTSTKTSISLDPAYEVAAGVGLTSMAVRKLADGTAIVGDGSVTYHAIVSVEDADGPGPASADVTGIPAQVTGPDIAAGAVTTDLLVFNSGWGAELNGETITGVTITGSTVRTAATGERLVLRNDGGGGILESFSGLTSESPGGLDPSLVDGTLPAITLTSGATPAFPDRGSFVLYSGVTGGAGANITAHAISLTGLTEGELTIQPTFAGLDHSDIRLGNGAGSGLIDLNGSVSLNEITGGSVGTETFRDSVDARVSAVAPTVTMTTGSVGTGTFRDSVRAALSGDYAAAWTTYTPSFTSATTALTLGSFTRAGRYLQVGKRVNFSIVITATAASGYGTGTYEFGLPVAARAATEIAVTGVQTGPNHGYYGRSSGGSTSVITLLLTSTDAAINSSNSGMASGTVLTITGTYEAA